MAKGIDMTLMAQKMGLRYYEEENLLFGKIAGYNCSVQRQTQKGILMFHITCRPAAGEDKIIAPLLQKIKKENPAVTAVVYENYTASLRIRTEDDTIDYPGFVHDLALGIAETVKAAGYLPCCVSCGKTKDLHRVLYDTDARELCPACRAKTEREKTEAWVKKKYPKRPAMKAWVVIFVVLLLAATTWIGLYVTHLSAPLVGAAVTILTFYIYHKMAGRMKAGSIITLSLLILLLVFICHNLCVAFEIVVAVGQNEAISITGALMFIPEFLKDPLNREVYFIQLGLAALAVAVAAAPVAYFIHRSWHHKEHLELLEEPD